MIFPLIERVKTIKDLIIQSLDRIGTSVNTLLGNDQVILAKIESLSKQVKSLTVVPDIEQKNSPIANFHGDFYIRHNQRRQEHLASLGINISGLSVLEVGAGIGDHTTYFLDRGCSVLCTEAREDNLEILRTRYPYIRVEQLDLDNPHPLTDKPLDVVYSYGLLYHLKKPAKAIEFMARNCSQILLLETCVSQENDESIIITEEEIENPTQGIYGIGCHPSRKWVYQQLKKYFDFVYLPTTQPNHPEFPIDWATMPDEKTLTRAVFIASRQMINNPLLVEDIPMKQVRH
ncbi:class I SAM-dependent methyltransferase [Tumidithrix elongata RA019]|uniref:Class I SAM-dependent methyltransferase n=1 Tax=Tumidithrix elongata BACA0141 TaxID=2716417 RepID=A0AAW9PT52_9CYAN|nr:class I SAM-dependent methyltransferase [Tumidithrix elongata RA019]